MSEISDSLCSAPRARRLEAPLQKPHLSPSQVTLYTKCGEAWRRRYINREVIPPGIALLKGTSVHRGAEHNFKQKIDSHTDLNKKEIVDFAVSTFETEIGTGGLLLTPEEVSIGHAKVVGEAKDSTAALAGVLAEQVVPDYQPAAVEQKVRLELPNSSHDLLSIADMIDDKGRIVELKTGKKWNQDMADNNVQITFQAATFRALKRSDPTDIIVENLVTKSETRNSVHTVRGEADYEAMIHRINAVLDGINKQAYTPAQDGAWWCSRNYCGYWSSCAYVSKARKQEKK